MSGRWTALTALLLLLMGLIAAATAVRSVSRIWLRHWAERRLAGSAVAAAYIDRPQRLLHGATVGAALLIVLSGIVLGARLVPDWELGVELVLFTAAMLVLGQYVPRAVGRRWAHALVPVLLPMLQGATLLVSPIARASQGLARAFRRDADGGDPPTERDEIEDLLREGELEGIGEREELDIITGVVEFGDKRVGDVMTPRTEIFAVDADADPQEIAHAVAAARYSRVPVYRESLDHILGQIHVLDVLETGGEQLPPLREVMVAAESKRCSELLFEMLRRQRHMAIVIDEFGGTAGLVTLEDVLEELVGDIRDEHDEPSALDAVPGGARALLLEGTAELEEVAKRLDVTLPPRPHNGAANTIGGVLVRALGRIPTAGERFRLGPMELTIVRSDATHIVSLLAQRAETAAPVDVALPGA